MGPNAMVEDQRGGGKGGGDIHAEVVEKFDGIARPANGDGGRGEEVFEDEIPANDPGQKFAQGRISVGVGTTSCGDHGGIFGITESGKETADT